MSLQLRDYQQHATQAVYRYLESEDGNPCVVIPTGGGKSLVIAQIASDAVEKWNGRVICLAHVKELLQQNAEKLKAMNPSLDVGIYSAGLGRRDRQAKVLVAGIQSVYQRAADFDPFDLILVDECHLLPPEGDGMYRQFLDECKAINPHVRLVGFTATPYRMKTGWLCGPGELLNHVCYEIGVKEMILDGWLSKLTSKEACAIDTSGLHVRGGEFVADEAEKLMLDNVGPAVEQLLKRTQERRSILVFCQSVEHAVDVQRRIVESCLCRCELVTGDTPSEKRAEYLRDFKSCAIKYLVNINVLTTGFDAPNVDCVALLRPTLSPGLYYQMVGRGFRLAADKENCLVLDFAGNIRRHGPVDQILPKPKNIEGSSGDAPTRVCPECDEVCHAAFGVCPACGFEFPDRGVAKHDAAPDTIGVTSLDSHDDEFPVVDVKYNVHTKKGEPDAPKTMRVEYRLNAIKWVSEWVCIEHDGYAGKKARAWWRSRSNDQFPVDAQHAVDIANAGGLAVPTSLVVRETPGEKFSKIVKVTLGEKPEGVQWFAVSDFDFPVGEESPAIEPATSDTSWVDELPW